MSPRSRASTDPGCANGATTTTTSTWDRQMAGAMEMSRRWRVITTASAKDSVITTERASPRPCAPPGPPTIRPTPASATTIATAVRRETCSLNPTQAISAAAIGERACMNRTLATVVWLRATMNVLDATAVSAATASSARPIVRKARSVSPRSVKATKRNRAIAAKSARPATCVAAPTESSRCSTPAVDHATAASAT